MSQLQMRVAVLEQEIKDKDQLMRRTKEVLEATQQQKVRAATSNMSFLQSPQNPSCGIKQQHNYSKLS